VQSINTRTTGLPLMSMASVGRVGQWLAIGLMIIGAAPGSAAGGLKVTSLYHLAQGTRRALARERVSRMVGITLVWIGAYLILLAVTILSLLATQPELPPDRLLFISASAVSLVGLSQDPISMTGTGLDVVSLAMLLGRVVPWIILWWTASTMRGDEADVAVG
jgi:trk system potassium uptake protein TrkH